MNCGVVQTTAGTRHIQASTLCHDLQELPSRPPVGLQAVDCDGDESSLLECSVSRPGNRTVPQRFNTCSPNFGPSEVIDLACGDTSEGALSIWEGAKYMYVTPAVCLPHCTGRLYPDYHPYNMDMPWRRTWQRGSVFNGNPVLSGSSAQLCVHFQKTRTLPPTGHLRAVMGYLSEMMVYRCHCWKFNYGSNNSSVIAPDDPSPVLPRICTGERVSCQLSQELYVPAADHACVDSLNTRAWTPWCEESS